LSQYLISGIATQAITYSLKFATDQKRPRGGSRSFPSGHTSFAFSTATVLYHIHKVDRPIVAWAFYLPAIVTGSMRIMRNDHWAPDVLVGAGIGILTTQLTYKLINKKNRHNMRNSKIQNLHFGMSTSGLSIVYQLF
jgi:membrane-associated phospholipid phosphatase